MRRKRAVLVTIFLLVAIVGGMDLWLRAQRRQYALNRALIAALVKGNNTQALALIKAGADPNTHYKPTPAPSLLLLVKQLLHRTPFAINNSPTALMIACGDEWEDDYTIIQAQANRSDASQLVQAMLRNGAMLNAQDQHKTTPLVAAVMQGRRNTMRLLLEHGADANMTNEYGISPLMFVDQSPYSVRLLLQHGANVNAKSGEGETALMFAVRSLDAETVRLLLEHGADVNVKDKNGDSALYQAVQFYPSPKEDRAVKNILRQLLMHGADPNVSNIHGYTPLRIAQRAKRSDFIALLTQYGAKK